MGDVVYMDEYLFRRELETAGLPPDLQPVIYGGFRLKATGSLQNTDPDPEEASQ